MTLQQQIEAMAQELEAKRWQQLVEKAPYVETLNEQVQNLIRTIHGAAYYSGATDVQELLKGARRELTTRN